MAQFVPFAASAVAVLALPFIEPWMVLLKVSVPQKVFVSPSSEELAAVIVFVSPRLNVVLFMVIEEF